MSKSPLLKTLLSKMGILEEERARQKEIKKKGSQATEYIRKSRELQAFASRIDRVLEQRNDVGGHLFLLDFSVIKEKLGAKWGTSSDKIHKTIKAIIQKHLTAHDVQFQKDDVTYLLLLPSLGVQEGQLKSSIIAEDVTEALIGANTVSSLFKVQTVTTTEDGDLISEETPPISNLLERVSERLTAMPPKPQQPSAPPEAEHPGAQRSPEAEAGQAAPKPATDAEAALRDFHFVFRPLLSVKTKVISTFLCIPVRETQPGVYASGYKVLGHGPTADEIYALDLACLDKVSKELWALSVAKKRSLLALPVHFDTLADHRRRVEYVNHCQDKFQELSNRVIFEITGLPDGIPQPRLLEFVSALKPVSRAVIARFSADHKEFPSYRVAGLHAVGIDVYQHATNEAILMKQMDKFAQHAHKVQLKSYVEGVRSLSLFTAAITSCFDYIAGYALSGVVDSAEDIKEFKLDSLYVSMLEGLGHLPRE